MRKYYKKTVRKSEARYFGSVKRTKAYESSKIFWWNRIIAPKVHHNHIHFNICLLFTMFLWVERFLMNSSEAFESLSR